MQSNLYVCASAECGIFKPVLHIFHKEYIYLATQLETRKFEVPVQIMHFTLWAS